MCNELLLQSNCPNTGRCKCQKNSPSFKWIVYIGHNIHTAFLNPIQLHKKAIVWDFKMSCVYIYVYAILLKVGEISLDTDT